MIEKLKFEDKEYTEQVDKDLKTLLLKINEIVDLVNTMLEEPSKRHTHSSEDTNQCTVVDCKQWPRFYPFMNR
jgi:hypothetical protein